VIPYHTGAILGIGIDTVEIARFAHWNTFSHAVLSRAFSSDEIIYCMSVPKKSAERFAVRFAAREAILKALSLAYPDIKIPLLRLCKAVTLKKNKQGAPICEINLRCLGVPELKPITCHLSWTHTQHQATALVVLSHPQSS
jgi:holo-[acyl-carrier protein] synthase